MKEAAGRRAAGAACSGPLSGRERARPESMVSRVACLPAGRQPHPAATMPIQQQARRDRLRTRRFGDQGTAVSQVSETELLHELIGEAQRTLAGRGHAIVVGSGDDAAVWRPDPPALLAITQDAVVEGVDYQPGWTLPYLVGKRSLTISLSDLASMGAEPAWCVVTYCASPDVRYEDLLAVQHGLCDVAAGSGCAVIGGDVSRTDGPLVVDVVAGGSVRPGRILRRDAGRPGDVLLVTGTLGRAAAGLRLLADGPGSAPAGDSDRWVTAQLDPVARLGEGAALAGLGVTCCGDLSDGLLVDSERTARASGCAAELWLDSVPVDPGLRGSFPGDWPALALAGGEDFELLAAVPAASVQDLVRRWGPGLAPLTVVGQLVAGTGVRLLDRRGGAELPKPAPASRHF
jgi:thiamine-monophosphate kinase